MKYKFIVDWLSNYSKEASDKNFVVGVSGGIDSALTSTLCAETGINTYVVSLPIKQGGEELQRAEEHIAHLTSKYDNVIPIQFELDNLFSEFSKLFEREDELVLANSRHKDLARDPETNTIVNVNTVSYDQYIASRKAKSEKNQKVQTMEEDLANVKSELNEIKSLLRELINGPK